jgi:hypothetical protein
MLTCSFIQLKYVNEEDFFQEELILISSPCSNILQHFWASLGITLGGGGAIIFQKSQTILKMPQATDTLG